MLLERVTVLWSRVSLIGEINFVQSLNVVVVVVELEEAMVGAGALSYAMA
jgi:hypothetical protein